FWPRTRQGVRSALPSSRFARTPRDVRGIVWRTSSDGALCRERVAVVSGGRSSRRRGTGGVRSVDVSSPRAQSRATPQAPRLTPRPRWPPAAIGAGALPLRPPRQQLRATPRRLYLLVYLTRRPGLRQALATGLMLGAFAAIARLGPHPFSLRGVVPILTAG